MAHAQKPGFVFRRNGWVHLSRRGRQFSRLLEAEVCASALVMLDTPHSEVVWENWLPTPIASFPFTSPPVRHRVPSGFKRTTLAYECPLIRVRSVGAVRRPLPLLSIPRYRSRLPTNPSNEYVIYFSRRDRKIAIGDYYFRHVRLSVCPHGTTQLPLGGFSWNLIFKYV